MSVAVLTGAAPTVEAPEFSLSDLNGPKIYRPTRNAGHDFYGGLGTACMHLAEALVESIGSRCTARTSAALATTLGMESSEVLRGAIYRDHPRIFTVLSADKIEIALDLLPIRPFNGKSEGGSNVNTAEALHRIFSGKFRGEEKGPEIYFMGAEGDEWARRLSNSPFQSKQKPLGIEDLPAILTLQEIVAAYPTIRERMARG